MKTLYKTFVITAQLLFFTGSSLFAQVCDPTNPPANLQAVYTPGIGAQLTWDPVIGSVAVRLSATSPAGSSVSRTIIGVEPDQFFVPDVFLTPGTYSWRVQATCNLVPPFTVTPISSPDYFVVGGSSVCPATVSDIDGNVYPTVEINGQCWMKENLKVEHYRNGDPIPTGLSTSDWVLTTAGAFAIYENYTWYKATYGLLYNGFAVQDLRGLCPTAWHVSTDAEWTELTDFAGGLPVAGGALKTTGTLAAGTGLWQHPNTGATNSSDFSAVPAGIRYFAGYYNLLYQKGYWWTSTSTTTDLAWYRLLLYNNISGYTAETDQHFGFSVRCLKD